MQAETITNRSRSISGTEFVLGAAVVIGHNVFHVLPNEVPILFVAGLVSIRVRNGGWAAIGMRRPESWARVLLIALGAATLRLILGSLVVLPLTSHFWPAPADPKGLASAAGDWRTALAYLGLVWTFAAVGEEVSYRGYLLRRAAECGGLSRAAYWTAMVLVSVLFGYGHYYKGPAGIIDSGVAGLILGIAFLVSGRNLWTCVVAHGLIDTVAVLADFMGWDK